MLSRRTISLTCPIVCTLCLTAGYAANGWGLVALVGASTGLAWWFAHKWAAHKRPATPLPLVAFIISMAWSAIGVADERSRVADDPQRNLCLSELGSGAV